MNPIKRIRLYNNLSAEDFARKVSLTPQTIWNLEAGLYTQPPPALIRGLALSPEDAMRLKLDYASWVGEQRQLTSQILPRLSLPWDLINSFEDFTIAVGGSVRGFCRMIVIQTSIVSSYIKEGTRWDTIASALSQCGLSDLVVKLLSELPRYATTGTPESFDANTDIGPDQGKHRSDKSDAPDWVNRPRVPKPIGPR